MSTGGNSESLHSFSPHTDQIGLSNDVLCMHI